MTVPAPWPPRANILNAVHLKMPFTDFTTSWKMTLKCEPSQYGAFLVCLQAHSMTVLSLSGVKRRGGILGALDLWAPSQKGWRRERKAWGHRLLNQFSSHKHFYFNARLFSIQYFKISSCTEIVQPHVKNTETTVLMNHIWIINDSTSVHSHVVIHSFLVSFWNFLLTSKLSFLRVN